MNCPECRVKLEIKEAQTQSGKVSTLICPRCGRRPFSGISKPQAEYDSKEKIEHEDGTALLL